MARCKIIPADLELVMNLAPVMREADRQEVWAAAHLTPEDALHISLAASRDAFVGLWDGRVVCAFGVGVATVLSDRGIPWLLGSDEMTHHAVHLLRGSRRYVARIKARYTKLENYVDARNVDTIRWLRWLGFGIEPAESFGFDHLPFHRFHWER